jgi:hypothetical protein
MLSELISILSELISVLSELISIGVPAGRRAWTHTTDVI